jgi:hypothetical protein
MQRSSAAEHSGWSSGENEAPSQELFEFEIGVASQRSVDSGRRKASFEAEVA